MGDRASRSEACEEAQRSQKQTLASGIVGEVFGVDVRQP
jgi:hypothetical protein